MSNNKQSVSNAGKQTAKQHTYLQADTSHTQNQNQIYVNLNIFDTSAIASQKPASNIISHKNNTPSLQIRNKTPIVTTVLNH